MRRRWIIDGRGPELKVDGKRLVVALMVGVLVASVILVALPSPADYVLIGVVAVGGIVLDIVRGPPPDGGSG